MKKKNTITVGIPAHNEEANIKNVIKSILGQEGNSFVLEKVIVMLDGCTDRTEEIVRTIAHKCRKVELLVDEERRGKTGRLNQLYKLNNSDLFIQFDADIVLGDKFVISKMVKRFSDKDVGAVSAANLPIDGDNFFQNITRAGDLLWYEIRKSYNNGFNIYNASGCATAFRGSFLRKLHYPKGLVADQQFFYHLLREKKYKFVFCDAAKVYYVSPGSYKEFRIQASRSLIEKNPIIEYFGKHVEEEYLVPKKNKMKGIATAIAKNPLYALLSILLSIWLRFSIADESEWNNSGAWKMLASTKKSINKIDV